MGRDRSTGSRPPRPESRGGTSARGHGDDDGLGPFHPLAAEWFRATYGEPTAAQQRGWPAIAAGQSTLIQAPTGSGKTLTAFYWAINRLMLGPPVTAGCHVLYVSPLKALALDVDRNLRQPLDGLAAFAADRDVPHRRPSVSVRTGDTPQTDRARFRRAPADILITTPESLYLLLTSDARLALRTVRTVIIDEVHALVPTKRGAHLALSLERLEHLCGASVQRIGLSATQRPLEEVAHFLGGARPAPGPRVRRRATFRPVTVVDTGERKALDLRVDVPVEDMARPTVHPAGGAGDAPARASLWTAIHPRLLELVRAHRSTLLFVNSRRGAERLAAALNDLAGEALVRAHHGSLAREQRVDVEESLKAGRLRGLVATSSLELGIDMGAIDLVLQIEAPPSVTSGLQRAGRGGHHVRATSRAVLFPKYRSDLLACAAVTRAMREAAVEATGYPRSPLDVLAQQMVAMTAVDRWQVDELYETIRRAAPFADLSRATFDGVLDMLSGRYPSDDFAELRPRVTWDRTVGHVTARDGARRLAIVNGGTIPDRGLYGVFLSPHGTGRAGGLRVGELDEEMVFESRVGETFVLGASTWRIDEITHDRVQVSPAPGEPGKMPFWKADRQGRQLELGMRIGALTRELRDVPPGAAVARLTSQHDLDLRAAENLVRYLADQAAATSAVPDDRTIVVERGRDEVGSWRVSVLSPFGSRVHAPWAMAIVAHVRAERAIDVDSMWTDDGFVLRFPESDEPPEASLIRLPAADVERIVIDALGRTAHFAARFREAAGRALLLPRRRPGQRSPLWQQRKRAADLLAVASRYPSFPLVLEAYRECLRDDFDLPALGDILGRLERGALRVVVADTKTPSPFAAALLFGYVANYLYDGDAPLAERRAQALAIDHDQLRALIGSPDLRDLLQADDLDDVERERQGLDRRRAAASVDGLHDLLLHVGDLSRSEAEARTRGPFATWADALIASRRAAEVTIAGTVRLVAAEHAAQYRDALAVRLPPGLPRALLGRVANAFDEIASRFARSRGPFTTAALAERYDVPAAAVEATLVRLADRGRVVPGEFRPGGTTQEWCAVDVLRVARRRSLARLRHEAAPVEAQVMGRFLPAWQGVGAGRRGLDAVLDAVASLQGAPLPASLVETAILPARVADYEPALLDTLAAAGEVAWIGLGPLGQRDGRIALYLADHLPRLAPPRLEAQDSRMAPDDPRERAILDTLQRSGASFFPALHAAAGGGYPGDTVTALWALVWKGVVTNDAFHALRHYVRPPDRPRTAHTGGVPFHSRRLAPVAAEGRWTLVPRPEASAAVWAAGLVDQWLARYGIVTRDAVALEGMPGGFSSAYPVLRALEEAGRIRRGYFVAGVAALQFAKPAAVDLLRSLRVAPDEPDVCVLAAADPANPYGHFLPWPQDSAPAGDTLPAWSRAVGTTVVLVDGALTGFWRTSAESRSRTAHDLGVVLPADEPERSRIGRALAAALGEVARRGGGRSGGLLIGTINGRPAHEHPLGAFLEEHGFSRSALGYHVRRTP